VLDWIKAILVATGLVILWPILVALHFIFVPILVFAFLVLLVWFVLKMIKEDKP
jgi:hypothetical protein